jgi:hypothetical protein
MEQPMIGLGTIAAAVYAAAVVAALLITQTRQQVRWPSWVAPAAALLGLAGWTAFALGQGGLGGLVEVVTGSLWGVQLLSNLLVSVLVAFFFLQHRARAAGMTSEVWVLVVILTGGLGLCAMLAMMLHLERQQDRGTADPP